MLERVLHILSLILKTTLQGRHNPHFKDEAMRLGEDLPKARNLIGGTRSQIHICWFPSKCKLENFKKCRCFYPKQTKMDPELPLPSLYNTGTTHHTSTA